MNSNLIKIIKNKIITDDRGTLSVSDAIPEDIKRIFYMYNVKKDRGAHANVKNIEYITAIKGSVKITLKTTIFEESYVLSSPDEMLVVPKEVWIDLTEFSEDCILSIANTRDYDEIDYFRSWDKYEEYMKNGD